LLGLNSSGNIDTDNLCIADVHFLFVQFSPTDAIVRRPDMRDAHMRKTIGTSSEIQSSGSARLCFLVFSVTSVSKMRLPLSIPFLPGSCPESQVRRSCRENNSPSLAYSESTPCP